MDPLDTSLLSCHHETVADGMPKTVQRRDTFLPEIVSTTDTSSTEPENDVDVDDCDDDDDDAASSRVTSRPCCDDGDSFTEKSEAGEESESRMELEAGGKEEGATCGRQANSWRSREVRVRF